MWIAFVFESDGATVGAGPFLDDVGLWGEVAPPPAFGKTAPADGATGAAAEPQPGVGAGVPWLYEYCLDTSDDNTCSDWLSAEQATRVSLSCLDPQATYYWQVRAVNPAGTTYGDGRPARSGLHHQALDSGLLR